MKNRLTHLVLHCTATPAYRNVTPAEIRHWHTDPFLNPKTNKLHYMGKVYDTDADLPIKVRGLRGRGWAQVGYSDMFPIGGGVINLVPYNDDQFVDAWELTNGILKTDSVFYNARNIVYVGGCDKKMNPLDTRTAEQLRDITDYCLKTIENHPDIKLAGHNQFARKACPSFSVPLWASSIGIDDKNIDSKIYFS